MSPDQPPDHRGPVLFLVLLLMVVFLVVAGGLGGEFSESPEPVDPSPVVPRDHLGQSD